MQIRKILWRISTAAVLVFSRLFAMEAWLAATLFAAIFCTVPGRVRAQSPELSMREFSSGQIKKGVRSIGFGGDGATWGNYGLVWLDASTVLVDYGDTHYTNGNDFHFYAVGATTPPLWHRLAVYVIVMSQGTNNVHLNVKSPGLGTGAVPVVGTGSDTAVFSKIALPVGKRVSVGVLLSHETSHFDATAQQDPLLHVHYQTEWRPSGGFGVAWQPNKRLLFGFRGLFNNDFEHRTDPVSATQGLARTQEYRLGGSLSPWDGCLIDGGATRLERRNALAGTHIIVYHPNLGFEQALLKRRLTFRFGLDETSPTAGFSLRYGRFKLDSAYVDNMAESRVHNLFGPHSNSFLFTITFDYARKTKDGPAKSGGARQSHQVALDPLPLAD